MTGPSEFRYPIEQTYSLELERPMGLAPSELISALAENPELSSYPLYFVARRPRLRIVEASATGGDLAVSVESATGAQATLELLEFKGTFELEEGGYFFEIVGHGGKTGAKGRAGDLLTMARTEFALEALLQRQDSPWVEQSMFDLEVLYVGMSHSVLGVQGRLSQHSKLQQILADHVDHAPDYELWVIPFALGPSTVMTIIHGAASQQSRDAGEIVDAMDPVLARATHVALAEAATIRLFSPEYNVHYRSKFPSMSHTRYAELFPYDYNSFRLTVASLDGLGCRLWSPTREASFFHEKSWVMEPGQRRSLSTVQDLLDLFAERTAARKHDGSGANADAASS